MTQIKPQSVTAFLVAGLALMVINSGTPLVSDARASDPPYTVEDGMVDKGTYNGYRRFHGTCHACHGQDAMGSSFAPSLVDSLKTLSYEDFITTVTEGRAATTSSGAASQMPSFKENPDIMKYIDDIYGYLKARSDGAIGTGRPKKIPAS